MQNIIKALAKPDDTALVSIFVPGELLTAAGITPYSVEAMSCFIAGTRCEQAFLAQTESEGFPETMCSYHRIFLGASMTGLVPKPKCTIYTNLACDGNMMTFPYLKQKYQRSLQSRLLTMKNLQNRQVMSSFQIRYLYRV